jgi:pyruvate dehydrogenase E2 component (dihydrolipoamide acetyltransferase)
VPDVFMPRLSDTMTEGVISAWLKHEGDTVAHGDVLAEIETHKAVMVVVSYVSGVLTRIVAPEGTTVPIGQTIAVIEEESAPPAQESVPEPARESAPEPEPAPPHAAVGTSEPPVGSAGRVRATPLVRRLARDHGLDLAGVAGTGPNGRIVRADIEALLAGAPTAAAPAGQAAPATPAVPAPAAPVGREDTEVPLSTIRRITAERLTMSAAAPHFHLTAAVDATPLLDLRRQLNDQVFAEATRCSVTDLLVRAVAVTLAQHPEVNASWGGDKVIRRGRVNVGIAVALDEGLIVPVVHDADRKGIAEIAAEARVLAERARTGRLTPDEFSGGTFTISNLGTFGIEHFTAVINPPEAAILAVGAAREEPVVRDGEVVARPVMRLTMTSDHRVLDGAVSAAFLRDLVELLGRPLRLVA